MARMANVGDKVTIQGIGQGQIIKLRFDENNREIFTVKMDNQHATPTGLYFARNEELRLLNPSN